MNMKFYTKRLLPYFLLFLPVLIYFSGCSKGCKPPGGMPACTEAKVNMVNSDNCTISFLYVITNNTAPYNIKIRFESNNSPITDAKFDYTVPPSPGSMPLNGYTVVENGESTVKTFEFTNPPPPFTGNLGNFVLKLKAGTGKSTISCELLDKDNNPCMVNNYDVTCK